MKNNLEEISVQQLFFNKKIDKGIKIKDIDPAILFEKYMGILLEKKVTDLHFSVDKQNSVISYRFNSTLIEFEKIPKKIYDKILTKIQILSKIDVVNDKDPSDGSFAFYNQRFRISLIRNTDGINCVIRKLKDISDLTVENLNYPEKFIDYIEKIKMMKSGLILFSGPTGSGKSTALAYILLDILKYKSKKIITIENPLEYQIPGAQQIEINSDSEKTTLLKNILRHDPDILMTGEIRTEEMSKLTVEAAMTGHLVFSTIHSNDVFNVINRLIEKGIKQNDILNSVKLIFNQNFVKIKCDCYVDENNKGCNKCHNTGYISIKPVFEILEINELTKEYLRKNDIKKIKQTPFYTFYEDELNQLLIKSKISINEYKTFFNDEQR
ncbi:type IV pilus assembly protein PilB [Marinitoga hydrogenitolerans DSM 16785]|uniref:Type IV pilus assembly protein PilB n=1 Tax=Marinitoga hydrogenitolerans (strain DSM 16785 / JCM 12826 / AT1271) TaxID=1122195 RepID=A0A1M4U8S5_MARH1|nr:ATPase, T2SS/T4P/T4SS family [Marinitoga hydrogenitolerans]SHE53026.1 type IV pilus assembly protein PilB [Marinitoga hydrogenitolerans DSM 16785]